MVTNIFLVCTFLSALVAAVPAPDLSPLYTDGRNFNLEVFDIENLKKKLGLKRHSSKENDDTPIIFHDDDLIVSLPDHFDARERWPQCPSLKEIRDQGGCGCGWAIAGVEVMTDRLCIHSNGTQNFHFSTEDLISCAGVNGCNEGNLKTPWKYWQKKGIVSGGEYKSNEGCYPFEIDPKSKSEVHTPPCKHSCRQGYNVTYEKDKRYGLSMYKLQGEQNMMAEIYKNGPIEVSMLVYFSFFNIHTREIYRWTDVLVGVHAVKLIGWGVENDVKYWLGANSWGTDWGDNGYFRILRGQDLCGIEGETYTSLPSLK